MHQIKRLYEKNYRADVSDTSPTLKTVRTIDLIHIIRFCNDPSPKTDQSLLGMIPIRHETVDTENMVT